MRTTNHTARGAIPLAVLLLMLAWTSWAVMGEGALHIDQAISPSEIYVVGTGEEEDATAATLNLSIAAPATFYRYPIDCLLLIDVSETSDLVAAKQFAYGVIDQLGVNDRMGLISYSTTAELDMPMTHNVGAVKLAVADLTTGGRSAMGLAMQMARREFQYVGRDDAVHVIILVTDGQSSVGIEPDDEGEAAAQMGIKIISVGNGMLINRNLLETFASQTDGLFFASASERTHTDIFTHLDVTLAASDVVIEKRIPAELRIAESTPTATQIERHPDGSTTAIWRMSDFDLGDAQSIVMDLEVLVRGTWETDVSSTVTYKDFRGETQVSEIGALELRGIVPNEEPAASFIIEDEINDTIDPVVFTDTSSDGDGDVVAWRWDFGDGEISTQQNPEHRYHDTGTFTVSLIAIDEDGDESEPYEMDLTIELGPRITVTRTITTCLPGDETVADAILNVTLLIEIRGELNGLTVVETLPTGWIFLEGRNDGATLRDVDGSAEWLFVEKLVGTATNAQREIHYSLQAPASVTGTEQFSIQGSVGSSSPRFSQPILGEDKITLREFLEIPVVISRWDTDADELVLCEAEPEIIDFAEIQNAISLWVKGTAVPQTNNLTIDINVMQDLIAYWLTGRSVHDSLP